MAREKFFLMNWQNRYIRYCRILIFCSLVIATGVFLYGCSHHKSENVERAIYYWKTESSVTENEMKRCDSIGVQKVYFKYFEVNFTEERGCYPEAKAHWSNGYFQVNKDTEIVPTVYLRNIVFQKSSREELDLLADNVNFLIGKIHGNKFGTNAVWNEIQMDCDWTQNTKENYFYFLEKLNALSDKQISCTLRLYPYKYPNDMGVPPVDKVMLMCYNLLRPLESPEKNTILDLTELKSYLNVSEKYPKHMDIALPVYSWAQVYHDERFTEVLYTNTKQLKTVLKQEKPMWYGVTRDTLINNTYLRVGDQIKYEEINAELIGEAIDLLKENIEFDKNTTIALFHLDEEQLKNFTDEELSSFYSDFGK